MYAGRFNLHFVIAAIARLAIMTVDRDDRLQDGNDVTICNVMRKRQGKDRERVHLCTYNSFARTHSDEAYD